ncbi:hypothetical protein [Deminuibacter soli]|uniref:Uncharacterized protein n=1 Tax=Deminuibacter soli TaxID=2291815 RepID=A0A3E1NCP6_9BACT|nr:hypothetical protein [Deminuibacter soli]RFM25756.1 hypothetical protein DXN05_23270 [Deminuibacter soli]
MWKAVFFTGIEKEGILLYDAGNTPLAERKPLSATAAKAIAQEYFDKWYYSAKGFLKGAGISHVHYRAISKIVRQQCQVFGLPYHYYPTMRSAISSHVRIMRMLGKKHHKA